MVKSERVKEMLENPNEHMYLIKDTYVVNDFDSILYNELTENESCLGMTAINENNIVYRGLASKNNFAYITQILDSIPRVTSLKLVYCSKDGFKNKEDKKEILTLLDNTFSKYKPTSTELKESDYIIIHSSGRIEYASNEIINEPVEEGKKIK